VKRLSEQTLARRRTLFWLVAWISTLAGGATACALVTSWIFLLVLPVNLLLMIRFMDSMNGLS
jgi:hypothetical protein